MNQERMKNVLQVILSNALVLEQTLKELKYYHLPRGRKGALAS